MGYLQGRGIHVDRHLSNIALNYRPTGFIADRIFPVVNVPKQSDMIKVYSQADQTREEDAIRSPGTRAKRVALSVTSAQYYAKNYALAADVTIEDRANADPIFIRDLEEGAVEFVTDKLLIGFERRVAQLATTAANVSTTFTVGSDWSDYTNSDPLGDMWTALDNQRDTIGFRPNRCVFSEIAFRNFSRNAEVINKIHKTGVQGGAPPASIMEVAGLLNLQEVHVGGAMYNSNAEGLAQSLTDIWGHNVLLYYTPDRPSVNFPSWGYGFRWTAAGLANWNVERHPYNSFEKKDSVEVGYYQDEAVLANGLATLVSSAG